MTFKVLIKPSQHLLFVAPGETVLDAAIRQNLDFPYSCRSGTCGTCMGKVLSGKFTYDGVEPYALDEQSEEEGYALFCSVKPESDMVIDVQDVFGPEYRPAIAAPYQVESQTLLGENLHQLFLKPASEKKLSYVAGQYLSILCDEHTFVPFSIAGAPVEGSDLLELHIHDTHSSYTQGILEKVKQGETLTLKGPQGNMIYRPEPKLPILFLAEGTGIVPFKAIIEDMLSRNIQQEIKLYWSVKNEARLYLEPLLKRWDTHVPNFSYTPLIGEVMSGDLFSDVDLKAHQVFASGSPEWVYRLKKELVAKGLDPLLMYSDVFEYFPESHV